MAIYISELLKDTGDVTHNQQARVVEEGSNIHHSKKKQTSYLENYIESVSYKQSRDGLNYIVKPTIIFDRSLKKLETTTSHTPNKLKSLKMEFTYLAQNIILLQFWIK